MADRCPVCTRERLAPGRTVCHRCVTRLRALLTDLADRMEALDAAVGRLLRFGARYRTGGRSADTPVPVNIKAADTAERTRRTILKWTGHVADARNEPTPLGWADTGRYLDVRATWIASQPAGPDAFNELLDALRDINRAIDRPAERHYAGPCTGTLVDPAATPDDPGSVPVDCDGELYARADRDTVTCPRCGATYDVTDRREWLLEQAWDTVATGPDIVRALAGDAFGRTTVHLSTLRRWAAEGRLTRVDTVNGRPRYLLGDVVALATGTRIPTTTGRTNP